MAEGKEKATEIEPRFNINAVTDATTVGSNSLRMSTNSTAWVDRTFDQIQWVQKMFLSDVLILYKRTLESSGPPISAEAATKAKKCRAFLERVLRFLRMSRTDLMRCSEGSVQRFMIRIISFVEGAKAMNLAPLQNHSRTPSLQQNGNCLQSRFGSSTGLQNSDPSSFKNSFQYRGMESWHHNQIDSPQINPRSPIQLEPKDLSFQLSECTTPFISTASPSGVPSSSTPSCIPADQEKGPLTFHPISLEESNIVTEAPIEPTPRLSEATCTVHYQSSPSKADTSQRLFKPPNDMLLQEIREINEKLIETVVDVVDDAEDISQTGCINETVVRLSYNGVRCNGNNMLNASMRPFPNLLLELIVPANYPDSSPVILERFPPDHSEPDEVRAVRKKAMSDFRSLLWSPLELISVTYMAKTWDVCASEAYHEFAREFGGGEFSASAYRIWED